MSQSERPIVVTADGSISVLNTEHNEAYHAKAGALTEARKLYIEASGFLEALDHQLAPLRVLDIGLGLGYNALVTIDAWLEAKNPPDLYLSSYECDDSLLSEFLSGQANWQEKFPETWQQSVQAVRSVSKTNWLGEIKHHKNQSLCIWQIHLKDLRTHHPASIFHSDWHGWQFVWQDPFSPKKNPDLWNEEWFRKLNAVASSDAVIMTYSVARIVKDSLTDSGWQWELFETNVSKRHWLRAKLKEKYLNL
jgi:chorismate dehydratase